jgi:hypothetical protein
MKYLLFIVLLVAVLITAGCVSVNKKTPVTPTTQTFQTISNEPIVGNWQWTTNDVTKIYKFYFFPDGRYSYTDPIYNFTLSGTWDTIRENVYNVTYSDGKTQTFVYNRTTDTFTIPEFSQVLVYRLGKEPVATIPTSAPTTIVTTTVLTTIPTTIVTNAPIEPIVGVWKLTFPDKTFSIDTYNQNGTYRIVSYGFDQQPTGEVLLGTWRKSSTNQYETADKGLTGESLYPFIYHADTDTMTRDFGRSIGIITYYRNNNIPSPSSSGQTQ